MNKNDKYYAGNTFRTERPESGYAPEHTVTFFHPQVGTLYIATGLDAVNWTYELNVANFPTYAGEVIQILGAFIGPMNITGTVQTYQDLENIYRFFSNYIQIASQGVGNDPQVGSTSYNQKPVQMTYGARGWQFAVMPTSAAQFRYGREVVAPQWVVQCHVVDHSGDAHSLEDMTVEHVLNEDSTGGKFDLVGEIGFTVDNPFSSPYPGVKYDPNLTGKAYDQMADFYNKLIPTYLQGDFETITSGFGSKPAFGATVPQVWDNTGKKIVDKIDNTRVKNENKNASGPFVFSPTITDLTP